MNRCVLICAALLMATLFGFGCSSGGDSPLAPTADPAITAQVGINVPQTHLWGYYDCFIDIENQTVEVVDNRSAMFAANIVNFVNGNPANLSFNIKGTPVGPNYIDVNIDVSIRHPFPGMAQYNGYDVRGIFCGDGSGSLDYNSDLDYPVFGTDQFMFKNPSIPAGTPDGYTRWFNRKEFGTPGLGGYTPGLFASKNFAGTASLMPYNYFADGLSATGDLWNFLTSTGNHGVFSAGKTNTRNYYLRFPTSKGVKYGYAIVANWINETTHPANAAEPIGCNAVVTDDIYYVDGTDSGGDLIADISLFTWGVQPAAIYIESNLFNDVHELDAAEMIPTGGNANYSTYHVEIPTDEVTGTEGNEFWVIAEMDGCDYKSSFGIPNSCGSDPLCAFFRYNIFTAEVPYNKPPVIISGVDGEEKPVEFTSEVYTVTATDPDLDTLIYTWTLSDADGVPVEDYENVAGDGAGSLEIDWGAVVPDVQQGYLEFSLDCVVSDGAFDVPAETLEIKTWVEADLYVSNHPDFASVPDNGTESEPYSTITQAINAHTLGQHIVVDYGTGTYEEQVYLYYSTGCTLRAFSFYTTPAGRPAIQYTGAYPVYVYYTNDVTIQGFKLTYTATTTSYYLLYAYYAHNISVIDCHFTGTINYYYVYGVYLYFCNSITVKNCKFSNLNCNYPSYTYAYMYIYYVYNGTGTHKFIQNEVTELQDSVTVPGYMNVYSYCYYWPAGSKLSNNLFHHISPKATTYFYAYPVRMYYPYATVDVSNNTLDTFTFNNVASPTSGTIYPMYVYNGGSSSYQYNCSSNIISNMNGVSSVPTYYGIYAYNSSPDYNDLYNIQDIPYPSSVGGPNSISADPLYVNNTTEPYDYNLDTGSPCIGTGQNGNDMGCYGNLPAGETIIGLLTPE